jgi:hypothetical protein
MPYRRDRFFYALEQELTRGDDLGVFPWNAPTPPCRVFDYGQPEPLSHLLVLKQGKLRKAICLNLS